MSDEVRHRVINCIDLVHVEARYHRKCFASFSKFTRDTIISPKPKPAGRPKNEETLCNFDKLCEWLESEAELFSMEELHKKSIQLAVTGEVYGKKWLKKKLKEKYQDFIFFADINGKHDIVCFRHIANYLINDKWYSERKDDNEDESKRIISTAAKILLGEIREHKFDCETYPPNEDIESLEKGSEWLPGGLRLFMQTLRIQQGLCA